jgi:hypothetical protein
VVEHARTFFSRREGLHRLLNSPRAALTLPGGATRFSSA